MRLSQGAGGRRPRPRITTDHKILQAAAVGCRIHRYGQVQFVDAGTMRVFHSGLAGVQGGIFKFQHQTPVARLTQNDSNMIVLYSLIMSYLVLICLDMFCWLEKLTLTMLSGSRWIQVVSIRSLRIDQQPHYLKVAFANRSWRSQEPQLRLAKVTLK